ncbi:radical SAM protein [Candidatus Omnitrophota bacterium]
MRLRDKIYSGLRMIHSRLLNKRIPLIVGWSITTRCHSRCEYCKAWHIKSEELGTKQVLSIIEEVSRMGGRKIQFTGGEPLLREDIGQIVDFCKAKGIDTGINSSGVSVKKGIAGLKNLDLLSLSLDGRQPTHDRLRGEGSYLQVVETAKIARGNGIKLRFTAVLSKFNLNDIEFILERAREFEAPVLFQPSTLNRLRSGDPNPVVASEKEYRRAISDLLIKKDKNKYIANSLDGLRHLYNWPEKTPIACRKALVACRIEPNGDVYICPRMKEKVKPLNCARESFKKAFYNLPLFSCDACWCAANVELNCLLSFRPSAVRNAIKLI